MNSAAILGDPSSLTPVTVTTPTPSPSSSSRKRNRENETPSQRIKREKAAERQRRKRERDRLGLSAQAQTQQQAQVAYHVQQAHQAAQQQDQVNGHPHTHAHPAHLQHPVTLQQPPVSAGPGQDGSGTVSARDFDPELTPEEIRRRDRVREAARKRQQKHRALVKARKMRELGVDMGNEALHANGGVPPGVGVGIGAGGEELGYPGGYQVIPPEIQAGLPPHPIAHLDPNQPHEPPFPQGQGHGGQMFATTLLLSFSCAPLLKQHLLNNLQMTNEELASLEPIIADAWDQWDRQRRHHYEQQGAPLPAQYAPMTGHPPPHQPSFIQPASTTTNTTTSSPSSSTNPPNSNQNSNANASTSTNPSASEFRERFHRSLVLPTPFQAQAAAAAAAAVAGKATGTNATAGATASPGTGGGATVEA